ncbi:MAG: alanine racemase [Actinomycetota bacterium]|nr:alanine racemase [Actinomycetota bacterium]
MTVRLTVPRAEWQAQVQATVMAYGHGLVPVVKGNGYGFGRPLLHDLVAGVGQQHVCVGTVHELHDVPLALTPIVLTPALTPPSRADAVVTVDSAHHVAALAGWRGSVVVKLASSMHRYGVTVAGLPELLAAVDGAGLRVHSFGLHLPLVGDDPGRLAEIESWLPHLPVVDTPLWVSHLSAASFAALQAAHPERPIAVRVGTGLWHGTPRATFLRLTAEVLHTEPVRGGDTAGYFHSEVPFDGTLVAVGAGSAHGVAPLDHDDPARRSPLHFERHRLSLLERPHMHTTMVVVPHGQPCPQVGDRVDVQRPLITVTVDELEWT